jgi:hypothetical protein
MTTLSGRVGSAQVISETFFTMAHLSHAYIPALENEFNSNNQKFPSASWQISTQKIGSG